MTGTRSIRIEVIASVTNADPDEVLGDSLHPLLKPFSEAGWGLGVLISREVHDYDEWTRGEIAQGDADEERGYRRAVVNLVDPAHHEIDMLEPRPPRGDLTPAGRLMWYREHQAGEQGWKVGERVCRRENVFAPDSPMMSGTVSRRYSEPNDPELYEVTWHQRDGVDIEPLVCVGFLRNSLRRPGPS